MKTDFAERFLAARKQQQPNKQKQNQNYRVNKKLQRETIQWRSPSTVSIGKYLRLYNCPVPACSGEIAFINNTFLMVAARDLGVAGRVEEFISQPRRVIIVLP